jgi:uncharacterized SAM-dependent methyltransferase
MNFFDGMHYVLKGGSTCTDAACSGNPFELVSAALSIRLCRLPVRGMLASPIVANSKDGLAREVRLALTNPGRRSCHRSIFTTLSEAFEVISELPEYGLTRADERLLERMRGLSERISEDVIVCELGSEAAAVDSGSFRDTGSSLIIRSISQRRPGAGANWRILNPWASLSEYLDGLIEVASQRPRARYLVLFLGTIGNFSPPADPYLLAGSETGFDRRRFLGTDLNQFRSSWLHMMTRVSGRIQPESSSRINRELGHFVLGHFKHVASFNPPRVEIPPVHTATDGRFRIFR